MHRSLAAASAFAESKTWQFSTRPQAADVCNGVAWLETEFEQCYANITHMNMISVMQFISRILGTYFSFLALTSAFKEINSFETSACPFSAETCNGVYWLQTWIQRCFANVSHEHDFGHAIHIMHIGGRTICLSHRCPLSKKSTTSKRRHVHYRWNSVTELIGWKQELRS